MSRYFESGAYRDGEEGKYDYEGFLCPLVIERYGEYMNKNRKQSDGKIRDSDNWQQGIPRPAYFKSLWRHFKAAWTKHRYPDSNTQSLEDDLCGVLFNTMGYLHEILKAKRDEKRMPQPEDSSIQDDLDNCSRELCAASSNNSIKSKHKRDYL